MKRILVYSLLLAALLGACSPLKSAARSVKGWLFPTPLPTPIPTPRPLPAALDPIAPAQASLNALALPSPGAAFRFLVVGHLYGTPNSDDHAPDAALLGKLGELNVMPLSFLVSLGDMVRHAAPQQFDALEQLFLRRVTFPVFNTVGNHDVEDRALYRSRYGPTYYTFTHGSARLVFLDTEIETCALDAPQHQMLARALQSAVNDPAVQHIFIFMHKTLFFQNDRLAELRLDLAGPNDWKCYGSAAAPGLLDLIAPAAAQKAVYVFSGDVGAWGNLSPYYEQRSNPPLTLVMTGLGDQPTSSGILVTVSPSGVRLELYPLGAASLPELETFTPDYWVHQAEKLAPRLP